MPPQSFGFSYGAMPNNDYLQQSPYIQLNQAPNHALNNANSVIQKPNDPYYNQMLEEHKEIWL
jgi:hypothetical protein